MKAISVFIDFKSPPAYLAVNPTAALAVIDFEFDQWRDIVPASGILVSFTRPRELSE